MTDTLPRRVRGADGGGSADAMAAEARKELYANVLHMALKDITTLNEVALAIIQKHEVIAADAAGYRRGIEAAAQIALAARSEAGLERHKSNAEEKACWLWAFDTASGIEREIRALISSTPPLPDR